MAPLQPARAWNSVAEWSPAPPCSGLAAGPLQPATQRPGARAPLIVPGRTRAGRRRATKCNSEHSSSGPGRTGRSQGRRAPGSSGPHQLWLYRRGRDPIGPSPTKRPGGSRGASPREVGFRVCFPNKTTRTRALPRQGLGGLQAARGPRATARALPDARQGRCARRREGARGPDGADRPPAAPRPARAALTGRLQGVGPEPCRPLAPVRSALPPARPRLLASRPRVPRSRPPPGSAGTSELEPLAAAPGFPQCTARRSSHPFPASRVRPPLPRYPAPRP